MKAQQTWTATYSSKDATEAQVQPHRSNNAAHTWAVQNCAEVVGLGRGRIEIWSVDPRIAAADAKPSFKYW
jgi:hypothetical protein